MPAERAGEGCKEEKEETPTIHAEGYAWAPSQAWTAETSGSRYAASVAPGPTFTPNPPAAAAARSPSSSVVSSPTKTGRRLAEGGLVGEQLDRRRPC